MRMLIEVIGGRGQPHGGEQLLGTGACAVAAKMFQTGLSGGPWWRFLDVALGALYLILTLVASAGVRALDKHLPKRGIPLR